MWQCNINSFEFFPLLTLLLAPKFWISTHQMQRNMYMWCIKTVKAEHCWCSQSIDCRDQSNNWQHQLSFFSRYWLFHLLQKVPVIRNVTSYSAEPRESYLTVTEGNCLTVNSSLVSKLAAWGKIGFDLSSQKNYKDTCHLLSQSDWAQIQVKELEIIISIAWFSLLAFRKWVSGKSLKKSKETNKHLKEDFRSCQISY